MSIMQHRRAIFTILLLLSFLSPNWGAAQTLLRVATPGGRADAYIRFMLAQVGLDHRTDALIIPLSGGSPVRLAAVIPVPLEYIWGINITRRSFMSKNRGVVKNYLRGLADSVRLMMADRASPLP
jgi:hypothetical protein